MELGEGEWRAELLSAKEEMAAAAAEAGTVTPLAAAAAERAAAMAAAVVPEGVPPFVFLFLLVSIWQRLCRHFCLRRFCPPNLVLS